MPFFPRNVIKLGHSSRKFDEYNYEVDYFMRVAFGYGHSFTYT